jgi:hypothetical protein
MNWQKFTWFIKFKQNKSFVTGMVLLFCFFSARAQDVKFFLSPSGNDQNTGTINKPFQSLKKALTCIPNYPGKKISIQLRGGTYYLDQTLLLESTKTVSKTLQITAYRNEKVFISAGRRLLLKWTLYKDGIYQAVIPSGISFERMYINGALQTLARYPNYDSTARVFHGTSADAIAPERVKRWANPAGGYIHALHTGEWGSFDYLIKGVDDKGNLQTEGGWQNNRPSGMHKKFRFVENIFEELDASGEWYLDRDHHTLYYYPQAGIKLSTALVEVSNLKDAIILRGTPDHPVRNVQLCKLNFVHTERSFMDTKEPLLRSDWTLYRGGSILFDGTKNCSVKDCSFTGLGGNAIMLSNYNKQDTITGCLFADIGASAICFVGDPKAVRSPLFKYEAFMPYAQLDKTPGPLTNNYPQECLVNNNLIHDVGEIEKQATGVEIDMASSITVSHNSIYNTPRAGINIGDGCWGGHVIEYNDVFNTVLETGDHGAFNSWGRDRYWSANGKHMDSIVTLHPELILLDVQKQNVIHDNRFRCDHGWDIDLDDGSSNYHIYNNVCLNGGIKLREGFYRIVENNIMINNSFHPHVWFKNSGDIFVHNIVTKKYFPIGIKYWGKRIDNNIFPDTTALNIAKNNGTDQHSIAYKVLFANAPAGNYTLAANSPAIAAGFQNIPMNEFGVQKESLKRIAKHAPIPGLITDAGLTDKSKAIPFLGGTIKSVDGLGERSAYGLPDETGVIILSTGKNSLLLKSDLMDKDVIRMADGKQVKDVQTLLDICQSSNWKGNVQVNIIRNQQNLQLTLLLK